MFSNAESSGAETPKRGFNEGNFRYLSNVDVIKEEEHKLSESDTSLNESDFDNGSSSISNYSEIVSAFSNLND